MMLSRRTLLAAGALAALPFQLQAASPKLRIGALKFGTLNWLIEAMNGEGVAAREGLDIEMVDFASGQATTVALQANDIDLIVSDWLWAMRRRTDGEDFRFAPFSNALGAVMAAADGPVKTLKDLRGRKLGVAGGALDKSWLLLRAYAKATLGKDLAEICEPVFGAPPLVNEQLALGRVDAVLTFWPFAARLDARGFKRLLDMNEVVQGLGITPTPPLVGFVWRERITAAKRASLDAFFRATVATNKILATSDEAWIKLRPLMQANSDAEFTRLRDYYRAGIPRNFGEAELTACRRLYQVLASIGGPELVGPKPGFDPALFGAQKG